MAGMIGSGVRRCVSLLPLLLVTLVVMVGLAASRSGLGQQSNDILGLAIPTEPNLDPNTVCKTYPDLTPSQYDLCSRLPDVTASAIQGIQISVHECQHQFKRHRWNCSSLEKKNKNPHSSPLLSQGFRETAFAYAVSSAGVMTQVARACSLGKLDSCGCQPSLDVATNTWLWKGCNHNVDYGNDFARKFLDSKESAKDLQSQINLHNNRAGRLAVRRNTRTMCKCHGMSGSCELKTCWKAAPPFRHVGDILKDKYDQATKVQVDNTNSARGRLKPVRRRRKRPLRTDLVYFERSPNFCDPQAEVDSLGTQGRFCNKSTTGIDNCETLCCGRGYNTLKVTRTERCHCRFHWCCYVICKKCTITDWVTVCK